MAGSINGLMTSLIVWLIFETRSKKQFFIFLVMCISILSLFLIFRNNFNLEYHKKARLAVYGDVAKISAGTLFGYGLGQFKYMFPLASSYKYLTPEDRKKLVEAVPNRKKLNLALNIISNGDVKFFEKENHTYSSLYFQAHNEYLEFWFEAGLVGFLLLVYAVVVRMVNGWKRDIPFYGVMASAITSLFFFTWHITPMALITVLYVGMMIGEE
jgi:hypothetical protein